MKVDKDGFHIPAWPMACPPVHPQADVLRYVIVLNRIMSVPSLIVVPFPCADRPNTSDAIYVPFFSLAASSSITVGNSHLTWTLHGSFEQEFIPRLFWRYEFCCCTRPASN
jgi:hypothetical protein